MFILLDHLNTAHISVKEICQINVAIIQFEFASLVFFGKSSI